MTQQTREQAASFGVVEGPLQGHHREWYVVRPDGPLAAMGRVKVGEPRPGILWFDRRSFPSEEVVLAELAARKVPRVPPVCRVGSDGPAIHGFVEGRTLAEVSPSGEPVAPTHLDQIMGLFGELARIRPGDLTTNPEDGGLVSECDSAGFLHGLIHFTRTQAYEARLPQYGRLFEQLGLPADALTTRSGLCREAAWLADRPFCLLHGDLHRANFIVDAQGDLWTIDWELATLGDPLYDLATHLHLMRYPPGQEGEVVARWSETVAGVLPGACRRLRPDLQRYLAYKRAQSVFTDVVRQAVAVCSAPPAELHEHLVQAAKLVHSVLTEAMDDLELRQVPGPGLIEAVYAEHAAGRPGKSPGRAGTRT